MIDSKIDVFSFVRMDRRLLGLRSLDLMVIFEFESDDRFLGWSSTDIWSDRPCEGR